MTNGRISVKSSRGGERSRKPVTLRLKRYRKNYHTEHNMVETKNTKGQIVMRCTETRCKHHFIFILNVYNIPQSKLIIAQTTKRDLENEIKKLKLKIARLEGEIRVLRSGQGITSFTPLEFPPNRLQQLNPRIELNPLN